MLDTDSKDKKADWLKQHTLSQEQLKKLIVEKFERAAVYQKAVRKREVLLKHR